MPGNVHFKDEWARISKYEKWLKPVTSDPLKANCIICKSSFSVKYTGLSAVEDHMKGKKHQERERSMKTSQNIMFNTSNLEKSIAEPT